jgi:hypothetical protein
MATKRKQISKRVRFEVFKRDGFQCQYCGASPPSVLLHVDHINPVALGGCNDQDNLVTSCEPCNLGKGAVSLSSVPQSLKDKAAAAAEREAQLLGYQAILEARLERLENECWRIVRCLFGENTESTRRDYYESIKRFVDRLGVHVVLDAAHSALARGDIGRTDDRRFRYFCGICWHKIRECEAASA